MAVNRTVIPDTWYEKIWKFLWKWISHPFRWCFSAHYRQWWNFKWTPDIVVVKPMRRPRYEEVVVQPASRHITNMPIMRFNLSDSKDQKLK